MDEIDNKIIQELMKDAQTSFLKIAKTIGVSHETVRKRYEKMKKDGTIERCSIVIDRSKIGYQGTAFLLISSKQNCDKSATINALKKIRNIYMLGTVVGAFDIFVGAAVKDLTDLAKLIDKTQKLPSVDQLEVALFTWTYFAYSPVPRTPIKCDRTELV